MKCLKIDKGQGFFLNKDGKYEAVDKMGKEDILYLLDRAINEEDFEIDDMAKEPIDNEAHKIIYKSVSEKFAELVRNKTKFFDESEAQFKEVLQKYK